MKKTETIEHPKPEALAEWYDERVRIYGRDIRACSYFSKGSFLARQRLVLEMLGTLAGRKILDIGCGPGLMTEPLAGTNSLTGLDISFEMLRLARKESSPVQGRACSLPFHDSSFDFVLAIESIQHSPDPVPFLQEMIRVTRPGGELVFSSLHASSLFHSLKKLTGGYEGLIFHPLRDIDRVLSRETDKQQTVFLAFPFPFAWKAPHFFLPSFLASSWILHCVKKKEGKNPPA